ncbi:hypothetical protein [Actinoplanes sp. N902-109]|uniref:hypothetical protein n=1 Tax=Actinoplanes sp. (strain N902-109) TaxID=649831 RepID=UPI00032951B9|nr:hypothetical protein [Actinoplanes sp. N902-109]AGL19278.1 putative serine/arginine repetitive matrix protein 1 [Actinoplanes sp. N902-109]
MNDLRNSLEEIAGPAMAPTNDQLVADIARGHKALRRRRTLQAAGGGVFAVAAVVAAMSFTAGGAPSTGGATVAQPAAPATSTATSVRTQLVAYTGKQPKGFTVDKVPDGWYIQGDNNYTLVIAPRSPKPGSTEPAGQPRVTPGDNPNDFVGKIVVMLQSKDQEVPQGKKIAVGDKTGMLIKAPDNTTGRTLWVAEPNDMWMLVQFWDGIGLTQDQMVDFGAGVHVHEGAQQGVG